MLMLEGFDSREYLDRPFAAICTLQTTLRSLRHCLCLQPHFLYCYIGPLPTPELFELVMLLAPLQLHLSWFLIPT